MSMPSYTLNGKIQTNHSGTQQLIDFFNFANRFSSTWFNLNIENLEWFDANLSALLLQYCYILKTQNKLMFYIDYSSLMGPLNVLIINGLAYHIVHNKSNFTPYDDKETTIAVRAFKLDDVDKFVDYIEKSLLKHSSLDGVYFEDKDRLKTSYFEIFDNVGQHGKTSNPILVCGQFFPSEQEVKFTFVDNGCGFLENISNFTLGKENIKLATEAISWAVKGHSTKNIEKGGTGLSKILTYCYKNGGELHIISDDCYWAFSNKKINTFKLKNNTPGATIHLTFRYLKKNL